MPQYGRKLEIQICKIEEQIFWKHLWKFNIFQQIVNMDVLYFLSEKTENYFISSIITHIILNCMCQSINSRFRVM